MSALATVAGKIFNSKFAEKKKKTQKKKNKKRFSDQVFYVTISDADIESLKSLHTLFDNFLDHMLVEFEQNCMVQTIQNCELFDKKKKMVNHFWQSVDAIFKDVSVIETIV